MLAEQLPAIIWSTDTDLRFTSASGGGLAALGLARDEIVGMTVQEYFGTTDEAHPVVSALLRSIRGEQIKFEFEWKGRSFEVYGVPFRDSASAIVGTLGIAFDVTQRRQAEQQGAALQARLRQKYKLEAVGQLASGLAHEINNPLQSVMNFAQLIRSRSEGPVREYASEILHEVQRIAASVRNLQSFVHHEGEVPIEIRMHEVVERTLSLFRTVMQKEQITLQVQVPEDLPVGWGKVHAIQQVLVNLLTAARDALNDRHPVGDPRKRVLVTGVAHQRGADRMLRLTVEDHGTPIRPEDLERVFEPFVVLDGRDQGSGLGLAVSRTMVRDSGGELSVESEDGVATRFHLDLPLADSQ
jgi:PAS domain S-box-containing protein